MKSFFFRSRFISLSILLIVLLALNTLSFAQDATPEVTVSEESAATVEIGDINDENFPVLEMLVSIRDEDEIPIANLAAEDMSVTVNGEPVTISSVVNFTADDLPISVVLVIDVSDSMFGLPMDATKAAAIAFVDKLAVGDEVAVVAFSTDTQLVQPFTTSHDEARQAIENLFADGRTALYDAVYSGAETATQANTPRRVVVLLTDGNEYGGASDNPPDAGIQLADENNVQIYTIGLGYIDPKFIQQVAADTGGNFYSAPTFEQLDEIYDFLGSYLRTLYTVTIEPAIEPNGEPVEISLTVDGRSTQTTYTPPDLYPQLAFEGLPGEAISEPVDVTLTITAPREIGIVTADIDGEPLPQDSAATDANNFSLMFTLDPYDFDPAETHAILVAAEDALGGRRELTGEFTVASMPPVFTISGLEEGATVGTGALPVTVEVERSQVDIDSITYAVDGQVIGTVTEPPYSADLELLPAGPGAHEMTITVAAGDQTASESLNFTLDPELFVTPSPTPTDTPTPTATFTPTDTPTNTPTNTPTDAPTFTPTQTATDTPAPTDTNTEVSTEVVQVVPSETPAPVDTSTPRPTRTPRPTNTATATVTDTATATDTNTPQPTRTPRPTRTDTPEPTATETAIPASDTPIPTDTPEPTMTNTPIPVTHTPMPTFTPEASVDVDVQGEDEGDLGRLLPIAGGILLLLILLAIYLASRRRKPEA